MADNTIELLGHYGGDFTHAQSAWCSTNRDMTPDKITRIPKLLEMLQRGSDGKSHETPFEKSMLHFVVTTEIATHIHLLKHRIGVSVNAESARYKELADDKFYVPHDWPDEWKFKLAESAKASFKLYHECLESLTHEHGIDKKRVKESARFFNPYATQLTCDISFNFRSFLHFCKLRAVGGAQQEVRQLAQEMIRQVMNIESDPFHHSIRVWKLDQLLPEYNGN
jgi:flavin-dependent thymidylate synthase